MHFTNKPMNTSLDPANNAADTNAALAMGGLLAEMNHNIPSHQALLATIAGLCSDGTQQTAAAPNATEKAHTGEISQPLAGRRILVADDNPVNLQVATRMLEKLGCGVAIATNGLEAVEMYEAEGYDLVLMDCEMPHMDGYEATARIRTLEGNARHTPIVALTALAAQGDREKCLAAGMDDYISKPVRSRTLNETLTRWLSQAEASSVPAASPEDELETIQEMFGTDFPELAALYLNDAPPRIAALHEAWQAGDHVQAARIAHAFAGSSASIGATGLAALCKELEISTKAGILEGFEEKRSAIEAEFQRISSKLHKMLGK
jgi:CheY-like chemotaxis protein